MRATGILEVNCYEVKNFVTFGLRGFFPLASLLSHSCIANVKTVWETSPPWGHRTLAVRDIKAGEEILTSYLRPSMCALLRRTAIRQSSPLSLVEQCRGFALIGWILIIVLLCQLLCHKGVFHVQKGSIIGCLYARKTQQKARNSALCLNLCLYGIRELA